MRSGIYEASYQLEYPRALRVLAAFFPAAERSAAVLRRATVRACRESALREAADRPSRFNALIVAFDLLGEGGLLGCARPLAESFMALRRVAADVVPGFGGGRGTPARRASDNPMAMACLAERAPCLPRRMSRI